MTYARRMKDDALLSVLRMSLTEFERLPAETRTSSGWKPEIVAITDFEQDREGGEWAEWFDMATVLLVADVRVAAERVGAQARRRRSTPHPFAKRSRSKRCSRRIARTNACGARFSCAAGSSLRCAW